MSISRRTFLTSSGALLGTTLFAPFSASKTRQPRTLILVELVGGFDSLSVFVPYKQEIYYEKRPVLSVKSTEQLPISKQTALASTAEDIVDAWESKNMLLLHNCGIKAPNKSHFTSRKLWSQSSSNADKNTGWLAHHLNQYPAEIPVNALMLSPNNDDLKGIKENYLSLKNLNPEPNNHALELSNSDNDLEKFLETTFNEHQKNTAWLLQHKKNFNLKGYSSSSFGDQAKSAAQIIMSGIYPKVIKLSMNGFDTHRDQHQTLPDLTKDLFSNLSSLRKDIMSANAWENVLIASFTEFGRSPHENASVGTDHGIYSTSFLLGGSLQPGEKGSPEDLMLNTDEPTITIYDYRKLLITWMQS